MISDDEEFTIGFSREVFESGFYQVHAVTNGTNAIARCENRFQKIRLTVKQHKLVSCIDVKRGKHDEETSVAEI